MSVDEALRSRHSKDLIVGECKNGSTWFDNHLRLDYWVLRRSWRRAAMIGYEVKSSRADWLKDQKWQDYLPLCNELWFIADPKHILPGELPEGIGHLRPAGSRLITVRKAAWREIAPPIDLLTYILMSRATIDAPSPSKTADEWRAWLEQREDERRLGYHVSKALAEKYRRDVESVRTENDRLKSEIRQLDGFRAALAERGIEWNRWTTAKHLCDRVDVPAATVDDLRAAHEALGRLLEKPIIAGVRLP